MAKKLTIKQRYNRQFKTVENRIKKLQSEGYEFKESQLPKMRKSASREGLNYLKTFTESKLKNLSGTRFRTRSGEYTTGKRGEELQRSEMGRQSYRTRVTRAEYNRQAREWMREREKAQRTVDETAEKTYKEIMAEQAFITRESNLYYDVDKYGVITDKQTGDIVFEPYTPEDRDIAINAMSDVIEDFAKYGAEYTKVTAEVLQQMLADAKRNRNYELGMSLAGLSTKELGELVRKVTYSDADESNAAMVEIGMLLLGRPLSMDEFYSYFGE